MKTIQLQQDVELKIESGKEAIIKITDGLDGTVAERSATLDDAFNLIIALEEKITDLQNQINELKK